MDTSSHIEHLVTLTLEQLDHPDVLPPRPDLHEHILRRMRPLQARRPLAHRLLRPTLLTVLVLVNIAAALWSIDGKQSSVASDSRQELLRILSTDLNIAADDQSRAW